MDTRAWVVLHEDGTVDYRASCLGACTRSLVAARLGEPPTPPGEHLQRAMDASSAAEEGVIEAYCFETGHKVIWQQKEVAIPVTDQINIVGHIDGMDQDLDCIVEVKSFGKGLFTGFDEAGWQGLGHFKRKYQMQMAVYAQATERLVRLVVHSKQTGELIKEPAVHPDLWYPMEKLIERVMDIESHATEEMYPPCDAGCSKTDAYAHIHEFAPVDMADEEERSMISLYLGIDEQIKQLEDKRKILGDQLKKRMSGTLMIGAGLGLRFEKGTKKNLDTKAVRKEHGERYDVEVAFQRLVPIRPKEKGDDATDRSKRPT